jgi:DNA helicase-2/ATP-dependent DNA helicase PcrA
LNVPPALLEDLNEAQRAAVLHGEGPLLIVAGAGSGKTRVITRRVAALVARGVPANRILAITFTNKAAGEMAERVERLLPGARVWVSTFHSAAARMLRQSGEAIGLPRDFTICDREDLVALVRRRMRARDLDPKQLRPEAVVELISLWKNCGLSPEEAAALPHEPGERPGLPPIGRVAAELWPDVEKELRDSHLLDFDDLLLQCRRLLADPGPRAGGLWRTRFEHVLVDEYQDVNRIQSEIADALCAARGNLTVCGDPDQSIYAWRGADLSNLLEFTRTHPGTALVRLERNYRSKGAILAVASAVIAHNRHRIERGLVPTLGGGERPRVLCGFGESDEADLVAREILRLVTEGGLRCRDVAVLYRTNALSRPFESALRGRGLPYRVVGALEFYARREIKDLLAWLRLKINPRDAESFLRVVNTPPRGIGEVAQKQLLEAARAAGLDYAAVVTDAARRPALRGTAAKGAERLALLFDWLRRAPDRPVAAVLQELVSVTGFENWLEEARGAEGEERLENVRALVADAHDFDQAHADAGLERFLEERALVQDADDAAGGKADAVSLMTLHSAKGLEFRAVFLAGLEETRLPHRRSESELEVEEERRLFYVGITRARDHLFLSHAGQRFTFGRMEPAVPSRFLNEIAPGLLQGGEGGDGEATFDVAEEAVGRRVVLEDDVADAEGLCAGDSVAHDRFGAGKVLEVIGRGRTARVRVVFRIGEKLLDLSLARLKKFRLHDF